MISFQIQCVEADEVARMFSLMGIMSALMPMIGNPAYRTLFDYTMSYFPRSVLILSSALAFWNGTWNVFLSTQKGQMRLDGNGEERSSDSEMEMKNQTNKKVFSSDITMPNSIQSSV